MKPNDDNVFMVIVLFHLRDPEEVCRVVVPEAGRHPSPGGLLRVEPDLWPAVSAGPWGLGFYSRPEADALAYQGLFPNERAHICDSSLY